jgi:hypothetical protein
MCYGNRFIEKPAAYLFLMASRMAENDHPKDKFLMNVHQTKELARSSRAFSFWSERLVFFSES